MSTIVLQQYMVANRIDECSQAFGLFYAVFHANQGQDAHEGFLPDILDRFLGTQSGAQFEPDELAEVGREMLFGARIAALQSFEVGCIERNELQAGSLPGRDWNRAL
jgi:hypothetical protein